MRIEALKMTPVSSSAPKLDVQNGAENEKSFGAYLEDALKNVNDLQQQSRNATLKMAAGQVQDISEVVIAGEKASVALQLTMQIRNKAIDAYQEIMRMQV